MSATTATLVAPWRRLTAAATAAALLLGSAGCASPYHFSSRLDTKLPGGDEASTAGSKLAGDLHLSLAALMDQRRQLWQAAGELEQMKTATALGLIGLVSAGMYRGLRGDESKGWLQRAGLLASATYAGANWLEPSARQRIYLGGAMSLTCLALATAPYEMSKAEFDKVKDAVAASRVGLERLASTLRLVGRYPYKSDTWWLVRGGWNKLRWANRVLDSADVAMGNIERAGPQLLQMTATLAGEVGIQVNRVSKDLSELTSALALLKPNANLLMGSEIFPPPKKDDVDADPPDGATDKDPSEDKAGAKTASAAKKDVQCGATTTETTDTPKTPVAPATTPAAAPPADASAKAAAESAAKAVSAAASAAVSAAAAASSAASADAVARKLAEQARARGHDANQAKRVETALKEAAKALDAHLGTVASFVQRVSAARKAIELPAACGSGVVTLVPAKRELVLQAGETFQFILQGDNGKASADFLGAALTRDELDLSMPMTQASTAVRLTAGGKLSKPVNTVVRITDSKGQESFNISVKVCPAGA